MSFIQIDYDDLYDLIFKFQNGDFSNEFRSSKSNFVIILRGSYQGSYGGIYHTKEIKTFKRPFFYNLINSSYCIVWWQVPCKDVGDLSLTKDNYALVTPNMYFQMKKANIYDSPKSSYY